MVSSVPQEEYTKWHEVKSGLMSRQVKTFQAVVHDSPHNQVELNGNFHSKLPTAALLGCIKVEVEVLSRSIVSKEMADLATQLAENYMITCIHGQVIRLALGLCFDSRK